MRPIDADALMKELEELREAYRNDHDDDGYYATEDFECLVRNATTKDVRPVVHGHWIERATDEICSVCGMTFTEMPFTYDLGSGDFIRNYCPYCGNPMDEKEEE